MQKLETRRWHMLFIAPVIRVSFWLSLIFLDLCPHAPSGIFYWFY